MKTNHNYLSDFRHPDAMARLASLAVFLLLLARTAYFYLAPDAVLIGVIPDDAFYYMQMAKHRVADGFWTFDGSSAATGFHFLYGYFLAFVYWVAGDITWRQLYLLVSSLASVSIAISALLTYRTAAVVFDRTVAPLAIAPFLTTASLIQSTAMMESWLVLLLSALTVSAVVRANAPGFPEQAALFAIGLLGSLARTDYGMLPGILFVWGLVLYRAVPPAFLQRTAIILGGAIVGVIVVLIQNYFISGHFAQASALVKLHWSQLAHHNLVASINLIVSSAVPFFRPLDAAAKPLLAVASILLLGVLIRAALRQQGNDRNCSLVLLCASLFTIGGYLLFYKHNSGALQVWYSANLVVPIALVLASTAFHVLRKGRSWVTLALLVVYGASALGDALSIPWPHQAGMMHAGISLRSEQSTAGFASWNAGIISYFSGKPVVNIDGLTNDEALPYIRSNTLFDYFGKRSIRYLVDYDEMLTNPYLRLRGGYEDERINNCVKPLRTIDGGASGATRLKMFEVVPDCR